MPILALARPVHAVATQAEAGFHSAIDKLAWDQHKGAGGLTHPIATGSVNGFIDSVVKTAWDAHKGFGGSTHPGATHTVDGFLTAADKVKLDAILATADRSIQRLHRRFGISVRRDKKLWDEHHGSAEQPITHTQPRQSAGS
jgi:hypothetical protein